MKSEITATASFQRSEMCIRDSPIAIGGLEASLRRFAHYDYWDDLVRPSILLDSGADLLMYGTYKRSACAVTTGSRPGMELYGLPGASAS